MPIADEDVSRQAGMQVCAAEMRGTTTELETAVTEGIVGANDVET